MPHISVGLIRDDTDLEAVRDLCLQWLDWHWKAYPDDWSRDDSPMDPDRFRETVAELPRLHARPRGGMFLARVDGAPAGCVMYHEQAPGVAEFKRLFVSEAGRGHGVGRQMLEQMFTQMAEDGYDKVMFSSAVFLTHARALYESVGFRDIPQPEGFPGHLRDYVYFMERPLGAAV